MHLRYQLSNNKKIVVALILALRKCCHSSPHAQTLNLCRGYLVKGFSNNFKNIFGLSWVYQGISICFFVFTSFGGCKTKYKTVASTVTILFWYLTNKWFFTFSAMSGILFLSNNGGQNFLSLDNCYLFGCNATNIC